MRNLLIVALIATAGWYYFKHSQRPPVQAIEASAPLDLAAPQPRVTDIVFRCEGKTRCHEMRSCEEATFYLKNCPGTRIDGDHDGIPCERSLC